MASSDEEDLAALRNAALASMKSKAAEQEPQGIQVLSSVKQAGQPFQEAGFESQPGFTPPQLGFEPHPGFPPQPGFIPQPGFTPQSGFTPRPGFLPQSGFRPQTAVYGQQPGYTPSGFTPEQKNCVNELDEVPYEFRQAVYEQQARSQGSQRGNYQQGFQRGNFQRGNFKRGRGFPRGNFQQQMVTGRGWGRGRGFNNFNSNFQEPPAQSALIVIQVEGNGEKEKPRDEKPRESRPLLLRPQDKWASTDGSSQCSTPPKPKDTSKFRRYDDDTDTEDEDEARASDNEDLNETREKMDMSLEDVSLEQEEETDVFGQDTSDKDENEDDMSENITVDEIHSDINTSQTAEQSLVDTSKNQSDMNISNNSDQLGTSSIHTDQSVSGIDNVMPNSSAINTDNDGNDGREVINKIIESGEQKSDLKTIESAIADSFSTNLDTANSTPLRDEPRHEESVSNSYSSFSRFNRRRKNSDSGDDSEVDSEEESLRNSNSNLSNWSESRAKFDMVSDSESEAESVKNEDCKPIGSAYKTPTPEKNQSPIQKSVQDSGNKSPLSTSSSSSHSSSFSSSSHSSSSPSSSAPSSRESSPQPTLVKQEKMSVLSEHDKETIRKKSSEIVTLRQSVSPKHKRQSSPVTYSQRQANSPPRKRRRSQSGSPKRRQNLESDRQRQDVHSGRETASLLRKRNESSDWKTISDNTSKTTYQGRKVAPKSLSPACRKVTSSVRHKVESPKRGKDKKSISQDKRQSPTWGKSIFQSNIKADPEFDAANYRNDKSVYENKSVPQHARSRKETNDKKTYIKREISDTELPKAYRERSGKVIIGKRMEKYDRGKETRHFKEISKLKKEQESRSKKDFDYRANVERKSEKVAPAQNRENANTSRDKDLGLKSTGRERHRLELNNEKQSETLRKKFERSDRKSIDINSKQHNRSRSKTPDSVKEYFQKSGSKKKMDEKNKIRETVKCSKSDSRLAQDSKKKSISESKSQYDIVKNKIKQKDHDNKLRRRSDEKRSHRKSGDSYMKHRNSDEKASKKEKRKSIEERLKKIADLESDSSSDSESDKNISSLSDMSSDSENETWRNKKSGASRNTDDIERERRRRMLLEREKRADAKKGSDKVKNEKERGDGDSVWKGRQQTSGRDRGDSNRGYDRYNKDGGWGARKNDNGRSGDVDDGKEMYYHRKKMVFYEEECALKKTFEEIDSDCSSDGKPQRGVISVVNKENSKQKQTKGIPSLLDIKVSRSTLEKGRKSKISKSNKKDRLVIQVGESADEDPNEDVLKKKKGKHKKVKHKKSRYSNSDEENNQKSRQQVVNVSFDKELTDMPRMSVYDRLGIPVNKTKESGMKRQPDTVPAEGGKRIKLIDQRKYKVTDKHKKNIEEDADCSDDALNKRIEKIQEKNAEILRRKREIEQDKQKYG